jgi:hypothetical protein
MRQRVNLRGVHGEKGIVKACIPVTQTLEGEKYFPRFRSKAVLSLNTSIAESSDKGMRLSISRLNSGSCRQFEVVSNVFNRVDQYWLAPALVGENRSNLYIHQKPPIIMVDRPCSACFWSASLK